MKLFAIILTHYHPPASPPPPNPTDAQKVERRERNREHAKRSRLRKKFLLESLQEQINGLQSEVRSRNRGNCVAALPTAFPPRRRKNRRKS